MKEFMSNGFTDSIAQPPEQYLPPSSGRRAVAALSQPVR